MTTPVQYTTHGSGRPLLAIHGFPLNSQLWAEVLPDLAKHHRIIAPDLRGFGKTAAVADTSMQSYVEDLIRVLDDANITDPVVLMGFSMGGYIAFEFWRRYPERVAALILANTRAPADTPTAAEGRHTTAEKVLSEGSQVVADSMLPKLFAESSADELKAEWRDIMANSSQIGVASALRAMATRPDSTETLPTITVPTLIIAGREDTITPLKDSEAMYQSIPNATLAIIEEAAHMTPVESPAAFAMVVNRFLQE